MCYLFQEHAGHIEKMRRALEGQVKELQVRLDEAEASAMKGGKRMIQKLEQRVGTIQKCYIFDLAYNVLGST